jgi:hypothetical protein
VRIEKWYLDCVKADGSGIIGYAARVGYGRLGVNLSETLSWQTDGEPARDRIALGGSLPVISAEGIDWSSRALGANGRWRPCLPGMAAILHQEKGGQIEWTCFSPAASARIGVTGRSYEGAGYAERLVITLPLSKLPIRELQWGRFISDSQSCVWIRWAGPVEQSLCYHNCRPVAAMPEPAGFDWPGHRLQLDRRIVIRSGLVSAKVAGGGRWLRLLLPAAVRNIDETKWCSAGVLTDAQGNKHSGWAVHEVAVFP